MPMTKADALAPLGVDFAHEALEFQQWKEERNKKLMKLNKGGFILWLIDIIILIILLLR